jgi:xylulose-5-phosphate/fructose-6-phosphate phosphoketolase
MAVINQLDRYHLAIEAIERVPGLKSKGEDEILKFRGKLKDDKRYVCEFGEDMPEINDWVCPY